MRIITVTHTHPFPQQRHICMNIYKITYIHTVLYIYLEMLLYLNGVDMTHNMYKNRPLNIDS